MRLGRLSLPEFSGRWDDPEKLPEFMRRMTDRSQRNNDEVSQTMNANEEDSAGKLRVWYFGALG